MSALSEHEGNGNPTETRLQPEDTKEQIYSFLQHFDILTSRFDSFLFKYIYIYLVGLFVLQQFIVLAYIILTGISTEVLFGSGLNAFGVVIFISVIWSFNVWRLHTPKTLCDLFEQKRIYIPKEDANISYFRFLENYHDALASPKRYVLSGALMLPLGIFCVYGIIATLFDNYLSSFAMLLIVGELLLFTLTLWGALYCFGIVIWATYISGWYVRKLVRAYEFRIQPLNTDKCGGFKLLGNFCFGLCSPLLIFSGLTIGYILLVLLSEMAGGVPPALDAGYALLLLLLYPFPASIFAFFLPLRDIHTKMVNEADSEEVTYNARIEALREEIQSLLFANQVEEATAVQKKKVVLETLHAPYPTWPFSFRSKFFSTVLATSGSILIGVITAALQQFFLPAILRLIFHTP
jgi:hypothetical protein